MIENAFFILFSETSLVGRLKFTYFLGCPSSCKCEEFHEGPEKTILVTGEDLVTVPSNLPSNTGAVYVTIYSFLRVKLPQKKPLALIIQL